MAKVTWANKVREPVEPGKEKSNDSSNASGSDTDNGRGGGLGNLEKDKGTGKETDQGKGSADRGNGKNWSGVVNGDSKSEKPGTGPGFSRKQSPRQRKKAEKAKRTSSQSTRKPAPTPEESKNPEDQTTNQVKKEEKHIESPKTWANPKASEIEQTKKKPESGTEDPLFVDLKKVMDQETEPKEFAKLETAQDIEEKEEVKPNSDDFEEEEPENPDEPGAGPGIQQQEQPVQSGLSFEEQATIVVASLDAVGGFALPPAYKRKLFKKEDRNKFKQCKEIFGLKKSGAATVEVSEDLKPYYAKYLEYKDLVDAIDFTEEESRMLIKPLAGVFEKYNVQAGPEISLIMAAAMVITPRLTPLFFD